MGNRFSPPAKVDLNERTFWGIDRRKLVILGVALVLSVGGCLIAWQGSPIYIRGAVAVLIAFLGVALAFGTIEGLTPEAWVVNALSYWRRYKLRLHGAVRSAVEPRVRLVEEAPAKAKVKLGTNAPDFFILSANAIALSVLTGLSLWYIQSGAHQLNIWWNSLGRLA